MQFGEIAVLKAQGAILAHSVSYSGGVFKKGRMLSSNDVAVLVDKGVTTVFAVRLEEGDVGEDEAATLVAAVLAGGHASVRKASTGRANIMSSVHGLAQIDADRINRLNQVHESLTVATVGEHQIVDEGQMLATIKVIPFAVDRAVLDEALSILGSEPALSVVPLKVRKVALIITQVASTKASLNQKSEAAMRSRIEDLGSQLETVQTTNHRIESVSEAIVEASKAHDLVLVFGASAIADRLDVVPAGLVAAGGEVMHLGMPVDPGNLMMLGQFGDIDVIGVPSCARSPKMNGFDWVLARVLAGVPVTSQDIMVMGVGGLLQEIASRPTPREAKS